MKAYYNQIRKHSHFNYLSPVQFENKLSVKMMAHHFPVLLC
ncbi:IS3 family transposase [Frischella japonica]